MQHVFRLLKRSMAMLFLLFYQVALSQQPVINFFYPSAGPVGTVVRVSGHGFRPGGADSNFVYFGSARATNVTATADSLIATVPAGATYAPITITSRGRTAYSRLPFNLTYPSLTPVLDSSSFGPRQDIAGAFNQRAVLNADLNQDGKNDLFVTRQDNSAAAVYKNSSTGNVITFKPAQLVAVGTEPYGAAAGDLNGDGRLDVVVANASNGAIGSLTVLRNIGFGDSIVFSSTTLSAGWRGTRRVVIADINGDGKPDLLVTSGYGAASYVSAFLNTTTTSSAITFGARIDFLAPPNITDVAVTDFDGDGKVDMASVSEGGLSVWKNTSVPDSIIFGARTDYASLAGAAIKTGDLNSDGKPDIIATGSSTATVSVFVNQSTTGTIAFAPKQDFTTVNTPVSLAINDLNGDGKPDVVVTTDGGAAVAVLVNASNIATISLNAPIKYSTGGTPRDAALGDLSGDGKPDIAVANKSNYVSIFKNNRSNPTPLIADFSPKSGKKGTQVSITGRYFTGTTAVRFGGVLADTTFVISDTLIYAYVDTGATGAVSVTTPYGTASKPLFTFIRDTTITPDTPYVLSFAPTSARQGDFVAITGGHFTGATAVRFGGVLADSVVVYNDSLIYAVVGNGASGNVSVTTPTGTASRAYFTYLSDTIPPVVTSFTPTSGTTGTIVTIFGKNFNTADYVYFGGTPAMYVIKESDTVIKAYVGWGSSGNVTVTSPYGNGSRPGFTYIDSTGTDTLLVHQGAGLSNDRTMLIQSFKLFPNPASNLVIWQQSPVDHTARLQLIDINGRIVKSITIGKNAVQATISVSGLHTGVYKLVWSDGVSSVTRSLLIK